MARAPLPLWWIRRVVHSVTGTTYSTDFPTTTGAFDLSLNSTEYGDSFVTKLNAAGSALIYSTYLGGSYGDYTSAIALDSSKNAYIVGQAFSTDFPTTPGVFQTSFTGSYSDAFVTKLNSSGTSFVYSTYLGGGEPMVTRAYGIALVRATTVMSSDTPLPAIFRRPQVHFRLRLTVSAGMAL